MYYVASFILWMFGWRVDGKLPEGVTKCIITMAPHTSNWDFIVGRMGFWHLRIKTKFLIKKEAFKPPMGWLVRWAGGLPVDRRHGSSIANQVVHMIQRSEKICIVVTPEGTRTPVKKWKKGFYFIAHSANVPIVMAFIDYKKKHGGLGPVLYPCGDYEKDLKTIAEFASTITPRHPERFSLPG